MNSLSLLRSSSRVLLGSFRNAGAESIIAPVVSRRHKGYYKSSVEGPAEQYTEVEKSYVEWKFVEKLLPPKLVPETPSDPGVVYPSGWKTPNPEEYSKLPYYIRRTKNGMLPVYYRSFNRGMFQTTRVRYVEGNVWILEKELGQYLKKNFPKQPIITHANEVGRYVQVRGDHEPMIKQWLLDKGF
ncbi:unnamed protein product [Allacma fusca]|uniref:Large ribosomal subunit protein mL49 n=1 Tax=Allacma fusca TaxID=39272 RepID=A0A8J2NUV5_9HEXA|nr:unnamed protein product [Allacma fusca]